MNGIARFAVLVAALASLFAVLSSTAGAVTWDNSGSTSFTATGGPGTLAVTGSGGTNNLTCLNSTAVGTAPADLTGPTYLITGTVVFGGPCKITGVNSYVDCSYTLTGASSSWGMTSGPLDVTCRAGFVGAAAICHISGTAYAEYYNPYTLVQGGGTTLSAFGGFKVYGFGALTVTGETSSTSCSSLLGSSIVGAGHLTTQTLIISGGSPTHLGPVINRTA
jgi:hypothetical protein